MDNIEKIKEGVKEIIEYACKDGITDSGLGMWLEDILNEAGYRPPGDNPQSLDELKEYDFMFELRHKADMRAVKMWRRGHPERRLVMPDHADMVCWLLERLDKFEATLKTEITEHLDEELNRQAQKEGE